MNKPLINIGKIGISVLLLVSNCNLDAQLLVDPYDTANTNYLVYTGEDGDDEDDDDRAITSGSIASIAGSSLPPPTLPSGLYFYGVDQGGGTWYVSTNGGFFPDSEESYESAITNHAGMWVFTDDLELVGNSDPNDYIITSQNDNYYAVTWKVHTHSFTSDEDGQQNFQVIWVKNDVVLDGQYLKAKDIVYAYGDMTGVFDNDDDEEPECGIGVTKEEDGEYVTLAGASTVSGSEGFITSFDDLPELAIFRWDEDGATYTVLTDASNTDMVTYSGKCKALYQTEHYAAMNWSERVPSSVPESYKIYRDGVLIQTVSASTTSYEDHNLAFNTSYAYTVYSVDSDDAETLIGEATITTQNK